MKNPAGIWPAFFKLLRKIEPIEGAYDVEWWGPYFIPRSSRWYRSHFLLYGGCLYGSLDMDWTTCSATWTIESSTVMYQNDSSLATALGYEELWAKALPQLTQRLKSALANPAAYNERVRRLIPLVRNQLGQLL